MFSNALLLLFAIGLVPVPVIAYSVFKTLNIRRALAVPLYRSQTLGVALVSLSFIGYMFTFDLYNGLGLSSNLFTTFEVLIGFAIPPFVTFYWIDASMRAARRFDPLLREVFHWRIVRIILWAWIAPMFLIFVGLIGYPTLLEAVQGQLNSPSGGPPPGVIFLLLLSPIFIVAVVGLVFLPRAAKKIRRQKVREASSVVWALYFLRSRFVQLLYSFHWGLAS